ncbi:MAG: hypothetical protein EOP00_18555 [Pedobacter sp.]|nr:MAG: hypothetical protein EOP00_18555 [Pedobacter sp.]
MDDNLENNKGEIVTRGTTKISTKILRENIPIAVTVITALGGVNQFYNLLKIDSYYVRFFSLTQLISDGLWIIYLLLPFYILTIFLLPFIFTNNEHFIQRFDPVDGQNNFKRYKAIIINLIIIILVYGTMAYMVFTNKWPYASMITLVYSFIAMKVNMKLGDKYKNEKVFDLFGTISLIVFGTSVYFTGVWVFKDNNLPENLLNKDVIKDIIDDKYPGYKFEVIYMNDKYIFNRIYCDSLSEPQSQVLILPAENFTESEKLQSRD